MILQNVDRWGDKPHGKVGEMTKQNYLVMNVGEYMDVIEIGEIIDSHKNEVHEGTVTNDIYRYNGMLYNVTKLNENVVYCCRLA